MGIFSKVVERALAGRLTVGSLLHTFPIRIEELAAGLPKLSPPVTHVIGPKVGDMEDLTHNTFCTVSNKQPTLGFCELLCINNYASELDM